MNELIKWTNLTNKEIASGLRAAGLPLVSLSCKTIKKAWLCETKAKKNTNRD
jgi:hypothetical protein